MAHRSSNESLANRTKCARAGEDAAWSAERGVHAASTFEIGSRRNHRVPAGNRQFKRRERRAPGEKDSGYPGYLTRSSNELAFDSRA